MAEIFLSYATEDRPRARVLAEALEGLGWDVWWDREIPVGSSFDDVIEHELDSAGCVVVAWTKESTESRWVLAEAGQAVERGKLVPVLLEDVEIPLGFSRIQTASLVDWHGSREHPGFADVVTAITALCGAPASAGPAEPRSPEPLGPPAAHRRQTPRLAWIGGVAALAVIAGLLYWALSRPPRVAGPVTAPTERAGAAERQEIYVVRILTGRGSSLTSHGFVTPSGHLVAFAPATDRTEYVVTWSQGGRRRRRRARVVTQRNDRGPVPFLALLAPVEPIANPPRPRVRNARSLRPGDRVERWLSPTDRTPGRVTELRQSVPIGAARVDALVTTDISGPGDAGAPVVDAEGQIVAVVVGGRQGETLSIPIEDVKIAFQEAF